jgi:transcriptional regulator with XRE-family HTH domain
MKHEKTAKRLNEVLYENNLTQQEFSNITGISKSSISQYLSGDVTMGMKNAAIVSAKFSINPAWLLGADAPKYGYFISEDAEPYPEFIRIYQQMTQKQKGLIVGLMKEVVKEGE